MASYSQSFPAFKRLYADFIALSQLAAALVVVTAVLFPGLRAKLAWRVLGLFWVLTGVNYYLKVVGGAYGTAMATVSVAEGLVLLVNWEKLRVFREVSCSTHLVLPMEVDLRSVNATIGCVGAFSLLVLPALLSQPDLPCYPLPHLLGAFTVLLLSMAAPKLAGEPAPVAHARFQQFAMAYTLPIAILSIETVCDLNYSRRMGVDQLIVATLLGISHLVKRRPESGSIKSHFRPRKGLSPVKEMAEEDSSRKDTHEARPASTNT